MERRSPLEADEVEPRECHRPNRRGEDINWDAVKVVAIHAGLGVAEDLVLKLGRDVRDCHPRFEVCRSE